MFMPRAVAKIIDQVARQTVGKDWNLYASLLSHWPEIVGQEYARLTTPVKVTFPHQPNEARRQGGTLHVRLPKGLAMEFTFKADIIRQRINGYFGYEAIRKVSLEPIYGAAPEKAPPPKALSAEEISQIKETAKVISNDELRGAVEAFGEALLHSSQAKDLPQ